jgi:hypothetical protein
MLARGERNPSRQDVQAEARSEEAAGQPHVYGIAARARIASLVGSYFRLFAPDDQSQFLGAEIPLDGAQLDLLFEGLGVIVWGDELKTGLGESGSDLDDQLRAELSGCASLFGPRFVGIRVLDLAAPSRSVFARPAFLPRPMTRRPL